MFELFQRLKGAVLALAALVAIATPAAATTFVPYGAQRDVEISTVTDDWGWTQIYRGAGRSILSYDTMFDGVGDYVMIGAVRTGETRIDMLGAVAWEVFNTGTVLNATNASNGLEWYNNHYSLGFAPLGAEITQFRADTTEWSTDVDRMSWHTDGPGFGAVATTINAGWRSAENYLYDGWDRIVFTADAPAPAPVPLPASGALMVMALVAVGGLRRWARG
ncbi:MAG: hypothetical protein AAFR57_08700 [Pseudomonadota bacterium]